MRELTDCINRARNSAFYKKRLPKGIRWEDIPFTTKQDLREQYPFGLLATDKKQIASYHESSGTSGNPTASFFTENDWNDIVSRFNRNAIHINSDDSVLIKTPYSMLTTGHQMHRAAAAKQAMVVPADNRSHLMPYSRVIRLLQHIPVTTTWSLPTELLIWATAAEWMGFNPASDFPTLRAFLVAGEALSQNKKSAIQRLWGDKPIWEDYGSTETGSLAYECHCRHLHLCSDRIYFEVFDPIRKTVNHLGRGQLVITTLFRQAMPLVRYLIGDEVIIQTSSCRCGSHQPTLKVIGRPESQIKIQNRVLFPSEIEQSVYSLSPEFNLRFWRAKYSPSDMIIEIGVKHEESEKAERALYHELQKSLGVSAQITALPYEHFLNKEMTLRAEVFTKPKSLFNTHEDWERGLYYA